MEVVRWQIIIIVSVVGSFLLHPRAGLVVAIGWTIETFLLIYASHLRLIQLLFTWGSYAAAKEFHRRRTELKTKTDTIAHLERELRNHPVGTRRRVRTLPSTATTFISGREHLQVLRRAVGSSQDYVAIVSGWVSSKVVDEKMLRAMWAAIERGVTVYIGYGFESFSGEHIESSSAKKALEDLDMLRRAAVKRGLTGGLSLKKFPTHEKILVWDDRTVVCGSNNWLSNRSFNNAERSIVVNDPATAKVEGQRVRRQLRAQGSFRAYDDDVRPGHGA